MCSGSAKGALIALFILCALFAAVLVVFLVILAVEPPFLYYGSTCDNIYDVYAGQQPICHPYEWRIAYFNAHGRDIKAYQILRDDLPSVSKAERNVTFKEKSEINPNSYIYAVMTKKGSYNCELSDPADFYVMTPEEFVNYSHYEHTKPSHGPEVNNSKTASFNFDESKDTPVYVVVISSSDKTIDASESGWFLKDTYDLEKFKYIKACSNCYFDMVRDPNSTYRVLSTVIIPDYNGPKKSLPVTLMQDLEIDGAIFAIVISVCVVVLVLLLVGIIISGVCMCCKRKNNQKYDAVA